MYCFCVNVYCTVLLPPGGNPTAVYKYININSTGLRTVLSGRLSHRELRSSLRESHSFLSLPADTTMASSVGIQPSTMNRRDEHRMIYALSNTTSYSTFYALFSSFRVTLLPMWLANSKQQPCYYPP